MKSWILQVTKNMNNALYSFVEIMQYSFEATFIKINIYSLIKVVPVIYFTLYNEYFDLDRFDPSRQ